MEQRENILNEKKKEKIKEEIKDSDIIKLSHELTYRRYLLSDGKIRSFFRKVSIPEYLALHIIKESGQKGDSGKTYLKEIADSMQRTVRQTSHLVKALQERGMLAWSHDGDGSEGTYVTITDSGKKMLAEEEDMLKQYYRRVFARFGKENLMQLLTLMRQLESVMGAEFKEMGAAVNDGTDE